MFLRLNHGEGSLSTFSSTGPGSHDFFSADLSPAILLLELSIEVGTDDAELGVKVLLLLAECLFSTGIKKSLHLLRQVLLKDPTNFTAQWYLCHFEKTRPAIWDEFLQEVGDMPPRAPEFDFLYEVQEE